MNQSETSSVKPFKRLDGEPIFDETWQAQLLAMVDQMITNNVFSNSLWSETLGANLKAAEAAGESDDVDTYYAAVLRSFEQLLDQSSSISNQTITDKQQAWERAYLNTPHGHPVVLED